MQGSVQGTATAQGQQVLPCSPHCTAQPITCSLCTWGRLCSTLTEFRSLLLDQAIISGSFCLISMPGAYRHQDCVVTVCKIPV